MFTNLMIILLVAMCLLFGVFYEFCGAVLLVATSAVLIYFIVKSKHITIKLTNGLVISVILALGYLVSTFYAIDRGMAFLGFIKILWIIPALICYCYLSEEDKNKIFDILPWIGSAMVIIGIMAYFITPIHDFFYNAGRFGGFFNYPNTQAIFLLLCVIWLCDKKKLMLLDYIRSVILLIGIGLTGSRIVFVLTSLAIIYIIFHNRNLIFIAISISLALAIMAFVFIGNFGGTISRITSISLNQSTFVGRLLYAYDAFPQLLRHPFGMGHLGYYYIQNSIQSGWYSIRYVHNDFLQIGLDIGIVPMVLLIIAIVTALLNRQMNLTKKIMLVFLSAHCIFEFNLTYGLMLFIMCILLDEAKIKDYSFSLDISPVIISSAIALCAGIYFSLPLFAEFIDNHEVANKLYPFYTEAKIALLSDTDDTDKAAKLSNEIISQNKTCALAYYAKAMLADFDGDYKKMIEYGKKAIELDYFNIEEYSNYTLLLYDGLINGTIEDYVLCSEEMYKMEDYMNAALNKLSPLGKKIKDQPELSLTEDMKLILDAL